VQSRVYQGGAGAAGRGNAVPVKGNGSREQERELRDRRKHFNCKVMFRTVPAEYYATYQNQRLMITFCSV
jgi:hypothetical protein